jgi:hypothetical protein
MLLAALESSELAGALAMSYALLLHQGAPTRPRQGPQLGDGDNEMSLSTSFTSPAAIPPPPGPLTVTVVKCVLCLINALALLDIHLLQVSFDKLSICLLKVNMKHHVFHFY